MPLFRRSSESCIYSLSTVKVLRSSFVLLSYHKYRKIHKNPDSADFGFCLHNSTGRIGRLVCLGVSGVLVNGEAAASSLIVTHGARH